MSVIGAIFQMPHIYESLNDKSVVFNHTKQINDLFLFNSICQGHKVISSILTELREDGCSFQEQFILG